MADLLELERFGEGEAPSGALAPVGSVFGGAQDRQRARFRRRMFAKEKGPAARSRAAF